MERLKGKTGLTYKVKRGRCQEKSEGETVDVYENPDIGRRSPGSVALGLWVPGAGLAAPRCDQSERISPT